MMNPSELLSIYDREQRIDLRLPEWTYENTGRIVRDYSLSEGSGYIDYATLDETNVGAEIDAQIAFFESLGLPFSWKVFDHDTPSDLRQRLAARGFEIEEPDALMILDLDQAPDFYWTAELEDCVRPVHSAEGVDGIARLEEEIWQGPRDWLRKMLTHTLEAYPERVSIYAVPAGGRIVSAAWTFYYPPSQFARLLGGATLPVYRGRGYYTALLVTRVREARRRGCRFMTVDASPMSRPILEKHGFQCLGFSTLCKWRGKKGSGEADS